MSCNNCWSNPRRTASVSPSRDLPRKSLETGIHKESVQNFGERSQDTCNGGYSTCNGTRDSQDHGTYHDRCNGKLSVGFSCLKRQNTNKSKVKFVKFAKQKKQKVEDLWQEKQIAIVDPNDQRAINHRSINTTDQRSGSSGNANIQPETIVSLCPWLLHIDMHLHSCTAALTYTCSVAQPHWHTLAQSLDSMWEIFDELKTVNPFDQIGVQSTG